MNIWFKITLIFILAFKTFLGSAEIINYPWPLNSELVSNQKYDARARQYDPSTGVFGEWVDLTEIYSFQRSYANHWKCGDDAGTDVMVDRSLTMIDFSFTGSIEIEVTQKLSIQNAQSVELAPKAFGFTPNYFDGKTVRFMMDRPEYVSVNFGFGSSDQIINRDDNRSSGFDIRHGCMIFAELPESQIPNGYVIPKPTDPGVVVWSNDTPLSIILAADIIYFPQGETELRTHPGRWERNSSWDKAEAAGNWVTTQAEYKSAKLYRGRLFLGKSGQKVYLAPGAIVYGGFHSNGNSNNWIYGTGIVTGRKHLMHEIVMPETANPIAVDKAYNLITQTKEAFCELGTGAVYDGVTFLEAWHHTCPSGQNSTYRRAKLIGWCSNNDGIRPSSGSTADRIFIKTSDDYDYARDPHTVRNAVFWPMVNGGLGQLGWNNLGSGYAKYYNMYVINSEWHLPDMSKSNIGVINGGPTDAGIKLTDDVFQDIAVENRTNFLVAVKLSGSGSGYLKNFTVKNITTEYPLSNPAGVVVKQELRGASDTWVDGWKFTNVFIDGVLLTWDNYKNYFNNLNLVGTNGINTDNTAKTRNITFDTAGEIRTITYTKTGNGVIRPQGTNGVIQTSTGMNQSISVIPNSGQRIKTITVDAVKIYEYGDTILNKRLQSLNFKNITTDHTLDVEFEAGTDYFNVLPILASSMTITSAPTILDNSKSMKVYPNPFSNFFFVKSESNTFEMIDLNGKKLNLDVTKNSNVYTIDASTYPKGIYILKNEYEALKLVKK